MVIEDTNKMVVKDLASSVMPQKSKKPNDVVQGHPDADARENRGNWKHPLDFLFSCISVSVGLGSKRIRI